MFSSHSHFSQIWFDMSKSVLCVKYKELYELSLIIRRLSHTFHCTGTCIVFDFSSDDQAGIACTCNKMCTNFACVKHKFLRQYSCQLFRYEMSCLKRLK